MTSKGLLPGFAQGDGTSDLMVGAKLGNYRLERLLGRGRMGMVYLARDEALLRPTAIKILSWAMQEPTGQNPEHWFLSEARNVARINHPHVVQIYGVARHGAYCYIAMEYVEGSSADVWIERQGPYRPEVATEILIQTASALQAAHDAKVVHRDVKPENLLVGKDGKAKLGDFGMALHSVTARATDTARAGTPHYTAPEIWRGEGASPGSDIYALGATYYYLLTGNPPYRANDLQELTQAHLHGKLPQLPTASDRMAGCQELIARCMAKEQSRRFPSAQVVGWEARALLRNLVSVAPPPRPEQSGIALHSDAPLANSGSSSLCPPSQVRNFFGFRREPFGAPTSGQLPYQGEPYATVLQSLEEHLSGAFASPVILVGSPGSGRSTVAAELSLRIASEMPAPVVSCRSSSSAGHVAAKLLRSLGVAPAVDRGRAGLLELLVDHCASLCVGCASPCLIVDDADCVTTEPDELSSLVVASHMSRAFRLVVVGNDETAKTLVERCASLVKQSVRVVSIAGFGGAAVAKYFADWMANSQAPGSAPLLLTPDACLIVAKKSGGSLLRINQLLKRMLLGAAQQEKRVLDSWDAWVATFEFIEQRKQPRPETWPTSEVLQLLNEGRTEAGLLPRVAT